MKYYILDLSPANSLVKYLVDQGHTVFLHLVEEPDGGGARPRDGRLPPPRALAALDAVTAIVPERKVHALGYCLGGTLLAIAAAAMARDGDDRLASLTLLAAQTDFTEAGELGLFIDESQVSLLERMMAQTGYLDGHQMAGAFQLLRSTTCSGRGSSTNTCWASRDPVNDLMAWNADATRHARAHAFGVSAPAVPAQRSRREPLPGGRPAGRARRHPGPDVRCGHPHGPRRALALGLQDRPIA